MLKVFLQLYLDISKNILGTLFFYNYFFRLEARNGSRVRDGWRRQYVNPEPYTS